MYIKLFELCFPPVHWLVKVDKMILNSWILGTVPFLPSGQVNKVGSVCPLSVCRVSLSGLGRFSKGSSWQISVSHCKSDLMIWWPVLVTPCPVTLNTYTEHGAAGRIWLHVCSDQRRSHLCCPLTSVFRAVHLCPHTSLHPRFLIPQSFCLLSHSTRPFSPASMLSKHAPSRDTLPSAEFPLLSFFSRDALFLLLFAH